MALPLSVKHLMSKHHIYMPSYKLDTLITCQSRCLPLSVFKASKCTFNLRPFKQ